MILTHEVCSDRNSKLGRELDEILARDSFEGLVRAELLPPRRKKKDRFGAHRTVIRIPDEPKFADYRGARMAVDWRTRKLRPLDQVVVRDDTGRLHSFNREEMSRADERLFLNRPDGSIKVKGTSSVALRELSQMALSKGARAASKPIDLEPPAYVLDDKFDRIRAFIMGEFKGRAHVRLSREPILADETPRLKNRRVHLILFERQGYGLRGRVSLFNTFTYDVMLCPNLGLIYSIKSGHAFDPIGKDVYRLVGISRSLRIGTR